jgi:cell division protein FtsI (penicillin-binding protein 3)
MANDGVYVAPRLVAATTQPQSAPQTIAFHPVNEHRVISSLTAAQMRQMMQGVVLHGTGKKALLIGYTSAGKTGTAQKVDPATRAYSHTKYVATFAGFAPINNPSVTIAVVLDSAVGLHQGGQVSAPVFNRIAQQVLEYLHTPHDLEIPANKTLLARAKASDRDLEEGSPDHPGESIDEIQPAADTLADSKLQQNLAPQSTTPPSSPGPAPSGAVVVAAMRNTEALVPIEGAQRSISSLSPANSAVPNPVGGTVVMEVEQGGIVVPSFLGKSVRSSIEIAQGSGLELNVLGSGKAFDQSPPPGSHVPTGAHITVRFGR